MSVILQLSVFIALVFVLSLMRGKLLRGLGSTRLYSIFFLPGTIIHELSHWVVAEVLRVQTGEITIFPKLNEGGKSQLGSVATAKTDPFRGFLIGIAPFISGMLILFVLSQLLRDGWGSFPIWQIILLIYGIVVTGNSMLISGSDRNTWPFMIILFAVFAFIYSYLGLSFLGGVVFYLPSILNTLNIVLGVTAGLNLVMITLIYIIRRII